MQVSKTFTSFLLICLLLLPVVAGAASITVKKVSENPTTYAVSYTDFADVGGVQVFVSYDPLTTSIQGLDSGKAIQDAGALFVPFDDKKGTMNFAAISTTGFITSGGELARITLGGSTPQVISSRALLNNKATRSMASPIVKVVPPPVIVAKTDQPSVIDKPKDTTTNDTGTNKDTPPKDTTAGTTVVANTPTTAGTVVTGGSVTVPTDPLAPPPTPAGPTDTTIELQMEAPAPSSSDQPKPADVKPVERKMIAFTSIVQRFKDFADEVSPAALIGLFVDPIDQAVKQTPAIAFTDGTSTFKVAIDSKVLSSSSPTMLLRGAKLLELGTEGDFWLVTAKTLEKGLDGQLQIQDTEQTIDVPLVIVPKIKLAKDKAGKVDAAEFARVLADRGKEKNPKFDFNGDGKHDALDDYIYTANYLKQTGIKPTKPKAGVKPKGEAAVKGKEAAPEKGADAAAKAETQPAQDAPAKVPEKKKKKK